MNDIRELSLQEIDAVAGAATVKAGGVEITAGDKKTGTIFSLSIDGVGTIGLYNDGACYALRGVGTGCTP